MSGIVWIEPVTDRSWADIDTAKRYLDNAKGKTGSALAEKKGCLNVSDLNRIENDIKYLSEVLNVTCTCSTWQSTDIPTKADKTRIMANASALLNAANDYFDSPPTMPTDLISFMHFNQLENVLKLILDAIYEGEKPISSKARLLPELAVPLLSNPVCGVVELTEEG